MTGAQEGAARQPGKLVCSESGTLLPGPAYQVKDNHEGASPERKTGETKP